MLRLKTEVHIRAQTLVFFVTQYGFVTGFVPQFSAKVDPLLVH
jgi:hypothetical protein